MTKWAYKRVTMDVFDLEKPDFEGKLDAVGKDGWELVASFDRERGGNSKEVYFIFKKPLD